MPRGDKPTTTALALKDGWVYEDTLPTTITKEQYDWWHKESLVLDGVRMGPPLTDTNEQAEGTLINLQDALKAVSEFCDRTQPFVGERFKKQLRNAVRAVPRSRASVVVPQGDAAHDPACCAKYIRGEPVPEGAHECGNIPWCRQCAACVADANAPVTAPVSTGELSPCPLADGGKAVITENRFFFGTGYGVKCDNCGLWLDSRARTKEEAIQQWNNRAVIDGEIKQVTQERNDLSDEMSRCHEMLAKFDDSFEDGMVCADTLEECLRQHLDDLTPVITDSDINGDD